MKPKKNHPWKKSYKLLPDDPNFEPCLWYSPEEQDEILFGEEDYIVVEQLIPKEEEND